MSLRLSVQTIVPLFSLILLGYLSRFFDFLREGDDRVFSSYLYYIGLPALLIVDLSELVYNKETLNYIYINMIPLSTVLILILLIGLIFRIKKDRLFLLIILSSFGNLGFFGLAFVEFAFKTIEAERYAALSISSINTFGFIISIVLLESYGKSEFRRILLQKIIKNLSKNPLIISIILGIFFSISNITIPSPISSSLHMVGSSVAPIAIFMLGVSIYGKEYKDLLEASLLSSIRLIMIPSIAFFVSRYFNLSTLESSIIVIMYGTPLALSMIILSQRYKFQEDKISSIILISSLVAGITMNVWLFLITIYL
jgi:predicted permease